ncbi:MAG TPA: cytochrome c [Ignavibacteria bacterium]|nr:cytochrome c [Ignavibacteria bacterium]
MKTLVLIPVLLFAVLFAAGCGSDEEIGIGPVKKVTLGALDKSMSEKGKTIFDQKCVACHKFDSKLVGPPLKGITQRRKPEWIMNMILNPEQMTKEDVAAKQLFGQYLTQMTFQNVSEDDARSILEYFRSVDSN